MKRKICIVTGTRADYGHLFWLMKEIQDDPDLELQIIATCMHLSPEFGLTYRSIEKDGYRIDRKIDMLLSNDSPVAVSKSVGLGMIGFADAYEQLKPDLIVALGDRYEMLASCAAAVLARVPIAHIHGGEITNGAYDESIRHSITKMATYHFVATEEYRRRVLQLGEEASRVFCYGAPGIDNIRRLKLMRREEFEKTAGIKLGKRNILSTFHPPTLDDIAPESQFEQLLSAFDKLNDTKIIFTYPNADVGSSPLIEMLSGYVRKNKEKCHLVRSLGQLKYLSALQFVDAVVGNSSSGIIEAPSFCIPTINIGDRQDGRVMCPTVITCEPKEREISMALDKAFSKSFRDSIKNAINPYGDGTASCKIKDKLKQVAVGRGAVRKTFVDLKCM